MIKCTRIVFWQRYKGYIRGGRVETGDKAADEAVVLKVDQKEMIIQIIQEEE